MSFLPQLSHTANFSEYGLKSPPQGHLSLMKSLHFLKYPETAVIARMIIKTGRNVQTLSQYVKLFSSSFISFMKEHYSFLFFVLFFL